MPCCFVVKCKTGYASTIASSGEKVSVFKAPRDPEQFQKWKQAIPKREIKFSEKSWVCAKHFKDEEIIHDWISGEIRIPLKKSKLIANAVPSIFPKVPPHYISYTIRACSKKGRKPPKERSISFKDLTNPKADGEHDNSISAAATFICAEEIEPVQNSNVQHEMPFTTWNAFDELDLSILSGSWNRFTIDEVKILGKMEFSNDTERRCTVVQELRATRDSCDVRSFILGKQIGSQVITSFQELTVFATHFSNTVICNGVLPTPEFNTVKIMKSGRKNILNRWQSIKCSLQKGSKNKNMCDECNLLRRALSMKIARITKDIGTPCQAVKKRRALLSSPEKKKVLNRTLRTTMKAKQRLMFSNNKLKDQLKLCGQKIEELSDQKIEDYIKTLQINSSQAMVLKEIIQMAKYKSKFSRRYSKEWILTCLLMHIRSPSMYQFISKNNILPLPSPRTVKRHMSCVKMGCGFDSCFFEALRMKMNSKSDREKYGILIFDEMSVRKAMKTDLKTLRYQGVVDFGEDDVSSTEKDNLADHALVFGFSSIMEDYFQPIGCFSAKGATNGITLAKLIVQAIVLLEKAGVKVVAIICDGAKPNRRMWKEFGISGKLGDTSHFFQNPVDENRQIFVLSDMPHLFKCIRNRLLNHELMTKFGWARWRHYEVLFEEEKNLPGNTRLCPRLTQAHVKPDTFARMRVSLMTQIFSKSVAVGLDIYRERLTEELEDSISTSRFTLFMNNLFDSLNRRYPGEAIKAGSTDIETMKEGIRFLDSWESEVKMGVVSPENFLTPETAEGLRVTLLSTIDLINFLLSVGFDYVMSARINQDRLERFFGTLRQAGCANDHPTMPTFLQLYRILSFYKLIKPPKFGNCSTNGDPDVTLNGGISFEDFKNIFQEKTPSQSRVKELRAQLDSLVEHDEWEEENFIAESNLSAELQDIIIYSASGYLCRRLIKMSKCDTCRKAFLTKLDPSKLEIAEFVNRKTRGFLLYCNVYLYKLFRETENFFLNNVKLSNCYEKTLSDVFENVSMTFPCDLHKSEVIASSLHYYILMRMRHYEREQNRQHVKMSQKKKKEAKVLIRFGEYIRALSDIMLGFTFLHCQRIARNTEESKNSIFAYQHQICVLRTQLFELGSR